MKFGVQAIPKRGKRGDQDFHQGYYEINEIEAQTVKNLFSWVADERLTLRAVVKRLQELGIKPRKSKRAVWSTSTLSTLLRNKTYIGEAHYGASYATVPLNPIKKYEYKRVKKTSRRLKPEDEWIKIDSPKIIEKDLFDRAGLQMKSNFALCDRNKKNEYLLGGRIWCTCGNRRTGEGPMKGKHLYYRCSGRVNNFPLPSACTEKGTNARNADKMVWDKISELMCSPELIVQQIEEWLKGKKAKTQGTGIDIENIKKEIGKLRDQEDRYAKAYGAGLITIDQLKDYTLPIRDKVTSFENQITKAQSEDAQISETGLPQEAEINIFAKQAAKDLKNLSFSEKQAIVRDLVEKAVGTKEELSIYGYIPIQSSLYVGYKTLNRHRRSPKRR